MATKSEIWEAKKLIKSGVEDIMEHLQRKTNWASRAVILRAFEGIKRTISPIITHIIDNDDYTTAVEINSIITPVFDGYFGNEPSEADFDREPEKNILRAENRSAYDFRDLVMDLRNWISEYEKQPHEPTPQPEAGKTASALPNQAKNFVKNDETKTILSAWYDFLKEECVIPQTITEHCFVSSMLDGDISGIYPISKKAKFKSVIAKIKKRFADSWFDEVCKSAGLSKSQMESWNVGEGTAKSVWEKKLKQIAVE